MGFGLGMLGEEKAAEAEREEEELRHICAPVNCMVVGTVIGGGIGMVLGVASGFFFDEEAEAGSHQLRISVVPQRSAQFAVVASVSF